MAELPESLRAEFANHYYQQQLKQTERVHPLQQLVNRVPAKVVSRPPAQRRVSAVALPSPSQLDPEVLKAVPTEVLATFARCASP